jgi:hypothetical protein
MNTGLSDELRIRCQQLAEILRSCGGALMATIAGEREPDLEQQTTEEEITRKGRKLSGCLG